MQLEEACKVECLQEWHNYKVRGARGGRRMRADRALDVPRLRHPLTAHLHCHAQECTKRIESDESGNAHCTGWAFDYWKCIDKCVSGPSSHDAGVGSVCTAAPGVTWPLCSRPPPPPGTSSCQAPARIAGLLQMQP